MYVTEWTEADFLRVPFELIWPDEFEDWFVSANLSYEDRRRAWAWANGRPVFRYPKGKIRVA